MEYIHIYVDSDTIFTILATTMDLGKTIKICLKYYLVRSG